MRNPDVSIIVPLLEEAESLVELSDRVRDVCDSSGLSFEVWLIDDGSSDESWEVIQQIHSADDRFAGVRLRRNYGKSAALAIGFERATGSYVVTIDADLQDDPAEIPELINMLRTGGYDLVSGWKKKREDPMSKIIPSRFFNFVTRIVSGIPLHDFNCGLKAYRLDVVKSVRVYGEMHRYIPLLAKWEGYKRIAEKPVKHHARKFGETKFGLERFVRGFLDLIAVIFLTRFARRPMHFFGTWGTISFLGGLLISLYLTVLKLLGHPIGNRPLLFLGLLLLILGAQLFSTGLLGEMIIRPNMERTEVYDVAESIVPARNRVERAPAAV